MLAIVAALAVKAAVSQVTIFSDRARVVRGADAAVDGRTSVELPLLPDSVDASSIRVEASGAEVRKVDVQHVQPDDFPADEARELLAKLEKLDDQLGSNDSERNELSAQLGSLLRITPQVKDEPLKPRPKLNARGWQETLRFAQEEEQSLRARIRDRAEKRRDLQRERETLAEKARILGGARRRSGWRVVAQLEGKGTAHLTLTYLAERARWVPSYDLQLLADQKTVRVSFSGAASQETGEDWIDAALTLSTAVPATARALPEIATWKIGEKERFVPTPFRTDQPRPPPPPPAPLPQPVPESAADALRRQLLSRAARQPAKEPEDREELEAVEGGVAGGPVAEMAAKAAAAPPPPPPQREVSRRGAPRPQVASPAAVAAKAMPAPPEEIQREQIGIVPPPSWRPPYVPPDSPAGLAGGYDLDFPSLRRDSLRSGGGVRRLLLFTETWPVTTERLLYPALAPDAYLVAQIRNPSQRTLPRGQAALAVGADPAGTAVLPLVAPGEEFTLPLGIDRALHPFRNVAQVLGEKGIFSKDEVTRYAVSIEVANPYAAPVPLRIVDQVPLAGDKNVEVELVEAPQAEREEATGKLTWRLTAPPSAKVKVGFIYQLKRPKGFKVHQ